MPWGSAAWPGTALSTSCMHRWLRPRRAASAGNSCAVVSPPPGLGVSRARERAAMEAPSWVFPQGPRCFLQCLSQAELQLRHPQGVGFLQSPSCPGHCCSRNLWELPACIPYPRCEGLTLVASTTGHHCLQHY